MRKSRKLDPEMLEFKVHFLIGSHEVYVNGKCYRLLGEDPSLTSVKEFKKVFQNPDFISRSRLSLFVLTSLVLLLFKAVKTQRFSLTACCQFFDKVACEGVVFFLRGKGRGKAWFARRSKRK